MRLKGQRVFISGAADGLGLEMAQAFAREGARLLLMDIDGDKAHAEAQRLAEAGHDVRVCVGSVADAASVTAAFKHMDETLGGIDALINNAGIAAHMPTVDLALDDWNRVMDVGVNGSFLCAQEAGRRMLAQRSGSIVNISSIYGIVAAPNRLAYCVSKSAVAMMARSLAVEWAEMGVRVNAIAPGYVHTRLVEGLIQHKTIDIGAVQGRVPMKRLGTPAEIAEMAVYLCSPAASYVTGQVIAVDGGWTAYGYI
jgi:Dehydrogenases with different specificities (related to short-chain alcohol dehydrogenases)